MIFDPQIYDGKAHIFKYKGDGENEFAMKNRSMWVEPRGE